MVAPAREYFDLMGLWVDRLTKLTGIDVAVAWLQYSPLGDTDAPQDPQSVRDAVLHGDVVEVAYRARLAVEPVEAPQVASCFWCGLEDDGQQVRIHFSNREGPGVLSPERRPRRRAELAATLDDARRAAPHVERIRGGSWLYHLRGYGALFPPDFLARAIPADSRTVVTDVALWGQFLRGDGTLYRPHADQFIEATQRASTAANLFDAFPLKKLEIVGPLNEVTDWLRSQPAR